MKIASSSPSVSAPKLPMSNGFSQLQDGSTPCGA
jgi:hypothetical protein